MKLKSLILKSIVLLIIGQYFAGQRDRVPRFDPKAAVAIEKPVKHQEKGLMEAAPIDFNVDLKEVHSSRLVAFLPCVICKRESNTIQTYLSMLNPLFLDRPPPDERFSTGW